MKTLEKCPEETGRRNAKTHRQEDLRSTTRYKLSKLAHGM